VARKHGRYSGACYIPGRFFSALEKIGIIHQVPILAIDWPSDSSYELITDSNENKAIRELIDDLIYHRFDYSKCEKIRSVRNLMLERPVGWQSVKIRRYRFCYPNSLILPLSCSLKSSVNNIDLQISNM
jgi:hypothetical protein